MIKQATYKLLTCGFSLIIQWAIVKGQKAGCFVIWLNFYGNATLYGFLGKMFLVFGVFFGVFMEHINAEAFLCCANTVFRK